MSKTKKYENFKSNNGVYLANVKEKTVNNLPAGVYNLVQDNNGNLYFCDINSNCDQIIDLPSKEFKNIVGELEHFLLPETQKRFEEYGYLYKRSALLYGKPGTGKTVIINRIAQEVVRMGGVVLFNPNPNFLERAFEQLEDLQPNQKTMVIFEELDQLLGRHESELLSLLDGEIQKNNVIYMATTNYIEKVPSRIIRPGRFSTVTEIPFPDKVAREFYLQTKLGNTEAEGALQEILKRTEGFSIDELKETILASICLNQALNDVIKRIKENKKLSKNNDLEQKVIWDRYNNNGYLDTYGESLAEIKKTFIEENS